MDNTRVIIPASGTAHRWKHHLGLAKHLAPIHGEPLIHRTQRQLKERQVGEVILISFNMDLASDGASWCLPRGTILRNSGIGDSAPFWSKDCRTTILLGDVVFSDKAIDTILSTTEERDVIWFGRSGPSEITGHPWKELFALSFLPEHQAQFLERIEELKSTLKERNDLATGGWPLYGMQAHNCPDDWSPSEWLVEINDETDDFDCGEDYDRWIEKCGP